MKDPAFLFYDGDAARDVSHMNRLERGAYFDLIQAQRKFGGYTVEQARKILGRDFDSVWDAMELILTKSDEGIYFIEWVKTSIENRIDHAEKQRKRIQDYWDRKKKEGENNSNEIPRNNRGFTLENEIENENIINSSSKNKYESELKIFDQFRILYKGTKRGNETEFKNFQKHKDWVSILPTLYNLLLNQIKQREKNKAEGKFVPEWKNLQTWINQRCWEEVIDIEPISQQPPIRKLYKRIDP